MFLVYASYRGGLGRVLEFESALEAGRIEADWIR